MRKPRVAWPALAVLLLAGVSRAGDAPVVGFTPESLAAQRALEARYDALLDAKNLRAWMERLSSRPHHLGSPWGKQNAEFVAGLFRSWGYETRIEEFEVLFPTPKERALELLSPTRFVARIEEPALAGDHTSGQKAEQLPTYNAYSRDGDVTGDLVYVNYGVPADYEELALRGIDVKGKIVIARYGGSWRGIKPKVAGEHGAVGCIIYSDPGGDGYAQGDPYPKGGWRPDAGVQRGSVKDMPIYSGDPLTPGVAATKDAKRLPISEATTLTRIPVLPISAADAQPLLAALGGPLAPASWRGALPMPYRLGPGPARVHLKAVFDWKLVTAYDVIATLPGAERPDEWVIRGNHHDAWVNGASDPVSGLVALLEEARAVGELARSGFRPRRTLVYAAWDGEEQGLLGSTEWVEAHLEELAGKGGRLHQLRQQLPRVPRHRRLPQPRDVREPGARRRAGPAEEGRRPAEGARAGDARRLHRLAQGGARPSGSGDHGPRIRIRLHAVPAARGSRFAERRLRTARTQYGQYHSIYDSFDHYTRFMDPDFSYGVTQARTTGRLTLRLAQADTIPMDFGPLVAALDTYVKEVRALADQMREETDQRRRDLDDGLYAAWFTPNETRVAPPRQDPVPHLNFAPMENGLDRVRKAVAAFDGAREAQAGQPLEPGRARELDTILRGSERALTRTEGLPGRPWYRHQIYAPGQYTGYGVKTLPAVREAIELRSWREAEEQAVVVGRTLEGFAEQVERATAVLSSRP